MKQNKNGILEGIIGEGMTFWLDTADIDKDFHSFYISKGKVKKKQETSCISHGFYASLGC